MKIYVKKNRRESKRSGVNIGGGSDMNNCGDGEYNTQHIWQKAIKTREGTNWLGKAGKCE